MEKSKLWKLEKGGAKLWRFSKNRKKRKERCFKEWNDKWCSRLDWESSQQGELFEVEWNQLIAEDWREDVKI